MPLDQEEQSSGRAKTFHRTQNGKTEEISRIDDILTQAAYAAKPGANTYTVPTWECHTDHHIFCTEIPYLSLGQLPLPKIEDKDKTPRTVLVSPMSKEDKQTLTTAMAEQMSGDITT